MRSGRLIRPAGLVPYAAANAHMHELAEARLRGEGRDTLILLEHPPVYTAGRTSKDDHVVWTEERMRAAGAELHFIDRGGSFTFHGPGQLVGYPIVDLGSRPEALEHVRKLEEVVIRSAEAIGIKLHRSDVQTGVWSGDRKVCAIGVRLMRMRVSLHGFALNCTTDLSWFDAIVPCGLGYTGVTSLSELAGRDVTVDEMAPIVATRFEEVFDLRFEHEERAWPSTMRAVAATS
ncbi:MAG TPA: lipoyl(octanoyl) transferase LipB [Actinomycetota bacterium]|nr:lipoyl(octanoyl) transferase LipB [Actinomycetota bacterium]